jgi:hypothetical protein
VQRRFGRLGDRLLGIVELTQEQHHLANFSPALYQAAVRQVADEAREYDFRESISARPAKKMAFGAGVVLAGWLGVSLVLPEASWNAFLRWAAPMGGIPRYTLVELEGLPREMIVPHGEPFAVSGIVRYRSFWKPGRVVGQLLTLPKIKGAVDSGKINLQIPGQVEDSVLRVHVGDAVAAIKISPVYRPSLRELTAQIQLPAYLQYPDVSQPVESGTLNAVEGSRISFHGNISRALASAEMQPADGVVTKLTVEGRNFVTAPAQPDGIAEYTFNWRDDLGLSNAAPLRLSVAMQKDAPPVPDLPGMPRETAMLDSDVLRIRVDANDDYGVRDFGLTWEVSSDTPLTESIIKEAKIMTSSPHAAKASRVFLWSPRMFRVPADSTVELQGFARDFYPDRERARTGIYRITVLSPEEHAELVREQLEGALAKIEEVTRLQEKIAANLRDARDNQKLAASQ